MKELVAYGAPGIETTIEPQNRLSRRQILFMLAFPLLFLLSGLLSINITRSLGPLVSSNPLFSTVRGFTIGILVFAILIPKVLKMPNGVTTVRKYLNTIGVDRIRPLSRTILNFIPYFIFIMALLNIVFNIGLVSTIFSLLWIFLVKKYWPLATQDTISKKSLRPDIISSTETKRLNPSSRVSRTNL